MKRRILFVTSSAPTDEAASTAPFILHMAQDLCALGYAVDILCPHAPGLADEEEIGGVRFIRFHYFIPETMQALTRGGGVLVNLKRSKWTMLLLPFYAIGLSLALWRLLRSGDYVLVHTHWLLPQSFIGGLLARYFRRAHIASVHGSDVFGLQHPLWLSCKRKAIACSDAIIANSHATATALHALEPAVQPEIIPVGASTPPGEPVIKVERSDYAEPGTTLIAFLGRLVEIKGLYYLLRALPDIAKTQKIALLVMGDGPLRQQLEIQARSLDVPVHFTGAVAHAHIYDYLRVCDVFVAPSIHIKGQATEAQGNSIVEAMMAGLPVIASDVGGIGDALLHEQTGLLVAERDPTAIAQAVERLLNEPELKQRVAAAGKQHALQHFARDGSAQKVAALYEAVLR